MKNPPQLETGQRLDLYSVRLIKRSTYEKTVPSHDKNSPSAIKTVDVWRYAFVDLDNNKYVYSGKWLRDLGEGETFSVRATVKKGEPDQWGYIRLARPVIIEDKQKGFL